MILYRFTPTYLGKCDMDGGWLSRIRLGSIGQNLGVPTGREFPQGLSGWYLARGPKCDRKYTQGGSVSPGYRTGASGCLRYRL